MATVYYTIHIPDADLPRDYPSVVLGSRFYFFNWITPKNASSTNSEMEVLCLDTQTLKWQRSTLPKEEGPESVAPTPRRGHALAAAGGRIFMWGGQSESSSVGDVLWWSPNEDSSNVTGAWRRLRLVDQRTPGPRHGHRLFSINDHYLVLAGGIDAGGRNSQDLWVLDLEARQWKFVQAGPGQGPYLWEGASFCAVDELPVPRLYVFGCELYRHHWNGASCLHLPGLSSEKCGDIPAPPLSDHVKARWQRLVLHSSCSLQWRSPCLAMDGCVYAFDVSPVTTSGSAAVPTASSMGVLALWRLSAVTHRWEWISLLSSSPAPLSFDAVAIVDRKVIILGRVCRNNADKTERDLHIIDFAPTLQTLCICSMAKNGIDPSPLPPTLRERIRRHCARTLT